MDTPRPGLPAAKSFCWSPTPAPLFTHSSRLNGLFYPAHGLVSDTIKFVVIKAFEWAPQRQVATQLKDELPMTSRSSFNLTPKTSWRGPWLQCDTMFWSHPLHSLPETLNQSSSRSSGSSPWRRVARAHRLASRCGPTWWVVAVSGPMVSYRCSVKNLDPRILT